MKCQYFFDFLSPFSYFSWQQIPEIQKSTPIEFEIYPVVLAKILQHFDQPAPANHRPKRDYLLKTCLRYSEKHNIKFTTPKVHPFNSLYALRLSTKEVAMELQCQVIDTLWKIGWQKGLDLSDPDILIKELNSAKLPAEELMEKAFELTAKKAVKQNTQMAVDNGIFGVPSFIFNGEQFWGNDSIDDLKNHIAGKDTLDKKVFDEMIRKNQVNF